MKLELAHGTGRHGQQTIIDEEGYSTAFKIWPEGRQFRLERFIKALKEVDVVGKYRSKKAALAAAEKWYADQPQAEYTMP